MPLISALWRKRQADLCEFEASLVYRVRFGTARAVTQRNPVRERERERERERLQAPSTLTRATVQSAPEHCMPAGS